MSDKVLSLIRWAILLRYPRLSYWYWKVGHYKRIPNPANPQTANDKFFWRKIFDRRPEFTEISDKLLVRDWLKRNSINIEGPPVLWSGTDPADIPGHLLSGGVVVKANHGSRTNLFLQEAPPNRSVVNRKLRKYLRKPHGRKKLEWGYFGVSRKLFVEKIIPNMVAEFKIFTFGERVERLQIIYGRFSEEGISADVWLPDGQGGWTLFEGSPEITRNANRPMPETTQQALDVARQIGDHFDHMRVDILTDGHSLWFSELTIYNLAGMIPIVGRDPAEGVNTSWDLQKSWFMQTPQSGWKKLYADRLRKVIASADQT